MEEKLFFNQPETKIIRLRKWRKRKKPLPSSQPKIRLTRAATDKGSIVLFMEKQGKEPISFEEERRLVQIYKNGAVKESQQALSDLICAHYFFMERMARNLHHSFSASSLEVSDLIQSGCCGFIEGIEHFEPERGHHILTYVGWWIYEAMKKNLNDAGFPIRYPMNWKIPGKNALYQAAEISYQMLSLEAGITKNDERISSEMIRDERIEAPEKNRFALRETIYAIMDEAHLTTREFFIIEHRCLVQHPLTLKQCASAVKISKERVRQLEKKAQRKLSFAARRLGFKKCPID